MARPGQLGLIALGRSPARPVGEASRTIITGAGRGLGFALVEEALARGHRVAATVRDPGASEHLSALSAERPERLALFELDLGRRDEIAPAIGRACAWLGGLDLLINSAGVNAMSFPGGRGTLSVDTLEPEAMLGILAVNTVAPLLVIQAALPALRAADAPRIVNISSWLGSITEAGNGNYAYATSKAALNMATRLLANEVRADGVVAVALNPGWVRTGMGGPRAELTPDESARGILDVAAGLGAHDSGRFLQWDGTDHSW